MQKTILPYEVSYGVSYVSSKSCPHFYLCHYCPRMTGPDELSDSLILFKEGNPTHLKGWIDCALEMLGSIPLYKNTLVLRALHNDERQLTGHEKNGLDMLGRDIAWTFGGKYQPSLLAKSKTTRKFGLFQHTKREREAALQNVYSLTAPLPEGDHSRILLIDDIVTTGATASAIIRVIKASAPAANITVFSLARASRDHAFNTGIQLKGRDSQWQPDSGWVVQEEAMPYGLLNGAAEMSLAKLTGLIQGDAF